MIEDIIWREKQQPWGLWEFWKDKK